MKPVTKNLVTNVHAKTEQVRILGVTYTHFNMGDEGDLYITEPGLPFADCLFPENHWSDKEWFAQHSERLSGTSSLFRATTKKINNTRNPVIM